MRERRIETDDGHGLSGERFRCYEGFNFTVGDSLATTYANTVAAHGRYVELKIGCISGGVLEY